MISPYLCFSRYVPKHVEDEQKHSPNSPLSGPGRPWINIHDGTGQNSTVCSWQATLENFSWAEGQTESRINRELLKSLFIYFTIRKNKERGGSSASKASLETVLPSRKTNPLFLTLDKFWSSRNESRDEKPVQMAFYPQEREIKFFRNYINWLFVPNSSSVQWKAQLVPIFLGYLENTQILENKNFQKQKYLGVVQNS